MGTLIFSELIGLKNRKIPTELDRAGIVRRGRDLEILTILWAGFEAGIALFTAFLTNSLALTGFGLDSFIEMVSAAAILWRLSHEMDEHRRHRAEHISLRIAGGCLLTLGGYVLIEASANLWNHRVSGISPLGILITGAALFFMPLLSQAKRRVGRALDSEAMMTDAKQTDFCMYQAAIVLLGLLVHALFGIGWADNAAALLLVPLLVRAGVLSLRGESCCAHHVQQNRPVESSLASG
jgi:divalent metal cation (Fe/Co/Zn/Cd) transporter